MIQKVINKHDLHNFSSIKEDLIYWLSKTPEERVAEVICGSNIMEVRRGFRDLLELLKAPNPSQDDPISVNMAMILVEHPANTIKSPFN